MISRCSVRRRVGLSFCKVVGFFFGGESCFFRVCFLGDFVFFSATMKLGFGKSKKQGSEKLKVETNGASNGKLPLVSSQAVSDTPKVAKTPKTPKDESSKGFIASITSRASLKKKKTPKNNNSEKNEAVAVPAALQQISKSEQELKSAFKVYDSDNDGRISSSEVRTVLTSLGGAISDEELNQLMKQIDTDNDGFISLEEFLDFHRASEAVSPGGEVSPVHDPMRDAFQMFDKDGDSRISASELQSVLVSLGGKGHSLEECKQMIESVDKDGDGYVDFMEFQELMGG